MDWQRTAYIGGMLVISLVLLFRWNEFQDQRQALRAENAPSTISVEIPAPVSTESPTIPETAKDEISSPDLAIAPSPENSAIPSVNNTRNTGKANTNEQLISVTTDTLDILIDRYGGDIVKVVLPQYKVTLDGEQGFKLLDRTPVTTYIAQSGLVGANGTDTAEGRPSFSAAQSSYTLEEGEDELVVELQFVQNDVNIIKHFHFERNSYLIKIHYIIDNQSASTWQGNVYGQIKRDSHQPPAAADSGFGVNPYVGAATSTNEENYKKLGFDDLADKTHEFSRQGGWVAMVQHYFTGAWIPSQEDTNGFFLRKLSSKDMYLMGFIGPQKTISAGSQGEFKAQFYVGPKDIDRLEDIAEHLDLTIDFGLLWWIAKPLFHLLDFLHSYIGNWGWSIIALTIIIKAIFFYPSALSYKSMAKMRKVSPKMQEIKDRFGDDRQKMSQEMMKLYKTEKVNPMGGCLPILIQMPVFIALYWVLMESVEIRHAPFILWISDLSVMDPYFILPLLMGATMFIQQKLNPTPPDPMQAKIMQWMPVAFTFLFLWFPAGLVVYWVTNNTLSIIQQYIITRKIEAEP
ncbi:MAG: membrane protein insertase YidC [Pseudomonadota bacterium]